MTPRLESVPTRYFDELYAADPDPWGFQTREYERLKYAATIAALPRTRYRNGFELGCSIGVLTRLFAERCGRLIAVDASEAPLGAARRRCADQPHVRIRRLRVPEEWPEGRFDLVVMSEILCFLSEQDLVATAKRMEETLESDGHFLVVHCLGQTIYGWSGDEVVDAFISATRHFARPILQSRTERYRIDVLERG